MKSPATPSRDIPVHDYGPAVQSAVSWLGERYLLADPVQRLNTQPGWHSKSPLTYFGWREGGIRQP